MFQSLNSQCHRRNIFLSASSIAESPVVRIQSGSVDLICVFSLHSDSMFQVLNSLSLNPEDINIGYFLCSFSCEPSSRYYIFLVRPHGSSLMWFMSLRTRAGTRLFKNRRLIEYLKEATRSARLGTRSVLGAAGKFEI